MSSRHSGCWSRTPDPKPASCKQVTVEADPTPLILIWLPVNKSQHGKQGRGAHSSPLIPFLIHAIMKRGDHVPLPKPKTALRFRTGPPFFIRALKARWASASKCVLSNNHTVRNQLTSTPLIPLAKSANKSRGVRNLFSLLVPTTRRWD